MAEGQYNQNNPQRGSGGTVFYVLLLLLLLGINIFLYVKYNQRNTETQTLSQQVTTDSVQFTDLNSKYQESLASIESYKGQNAQLDSMIAIKEKSLAELKRSYASLQNKNKISKADFDKQVASMNDIVSDLQDQIASLKEQLNIQISKNDTLGHSLANEISTNAQLTNTNTALIKKVSIGSLLKPGAINVSGVRFKSNGKEDETDNSKKTDKLKICWTIPENAVADTGEKTFYVRVINPEQVTMTAEGGSGIMNDANDGSQIQYSTIVSVNYMQKATDACTYWSQNAPFNKGNYTINIYQDGYLIGTQKLLLK